MLGSLLYNIKWGKTLFLKCVQAPISPCTYDENMYEMNDFFSRKKELESNSRLATLC